MPLSQRSFPLIEGSLSLRLGAHFVSAVSTSRLLISIGLISFNYLMANSLKLKSWIAFAIDVRKTGFLISQIEIGLASKNSSILYSSFQKMYLGPSPESDIVLKIRASTYLLMTLHSNFLYRTGFGFCVSFSHSTLQHALLIPDILFILTFSIVASFQLGN